MANNLIDRGWNRKVLLTVNKTYVSSNETNFPVMLFWNGSSGNLPTEVFNNSSSSPKSDGRDIRFSQDYDGSLEMPLEIVTFNTDSTVANARVEIHTKLTNLYTATDTTFFMWWNNGSATAYGNSDSYGTYNVWCDNCVGVYHLNEVDGTVAKNSSDNILNGTYDGTSFPNRLDSSYGYAQTFINANSNHVSMGNDPLLDITGSIGISAVFNYSSWTAAWQAMVAKGDTAYRLHRNGTSQTLSFGRSLQGGGSLDTYGAVNLTAGKYYHAFGRFDSASGTQVFIDGTPSALDSTTTITNSNANIVAIGRNSSILTRDWNGDIAEVRIYNVVRSDGWIKAEYNNLMNFSSFVSTSPIDNVDFSEIGSNF